MQNFALFAFSTLATALEDDTSLLQRQGTTMIREIEQKLVQRSEARIERDLQGATTAITENSLWGKLPGEGETKKIQNTTLLFQCDLSVIGKCFKGAFRQEGTAAPSPSSISSLFGPSEYPASERFKTAVKSPVSGKQYHTIDRIEWKIAQRINKLRREGFQCQKFPGFGCESQPCPAGQNIIPPRTNDLIFDCRSWWTAMLHSEDMTKRAYYSHMTPSGVFDNQVTGKKETFPAQLGPWDRGDKWAWGMPVHSEIIVSAPEHQTKDANVFTRDSKGALDPQGEDNYVNLVVQKWLDSPAHCNGMGDHQNQLIGVGRAFCAVQGTEQDGNLNNCVTEGDISMYNIDKSRWYWTAVFTYAEPSYDPKTDPLRTPAVRKVGGDTSCQIAPGDKLGVGR